MPSKEWQHSNQSPKNEHPSASVRLLRWLVRLPALLLIGIIRLYKLFISPLLPPSCRFLPTCSEYTMEALQVHGFWRGLYLGTRRIMRCHPGNPGGFDPVPQKRG